MARIEIMLNGRGYNIACAPGEEPRVVELAGYVDSKLRQIAMSTAAGSDAQMMALTALTLADELFDLKYELEKMGRGDTVEKVEANRAASSLQNKKMEEKLTKSVDNITARLEKALSSLEESESKAS